MKSYRNPHYFRFWCQKVLPLVYDDSLSYYELLCKFVRYLNDLIEDNDTIKENLQELETYVKTYFDNLDVQEEINNKLDQMAADGSLMALINIQHGSKLSMQRAAIYAEFNARNMNRNALPADYSFVQSACSDNSYVYMMGYAFGYQDEKHIKVMKYTADFTSKIAENMIEATHANGSCIFNGKLHITNSNKNITVVNTDTLTVENVVNLAGVVNDNIYVLFTAPYNNNTCLYAGTDTTWYILNNEYKLIDTVYINYNGPLPNASGNACYYDGFVFKCGWPNVVFSFSLTGDLINVYNIGTVQYDYIVGECEACFTVNDKLYLTCSEPAGWPTGTIITQIFECNPKHGIYEFYTDDKYIYSTRTIYVDANYTGIISDGTQQYPYKSLTWALAECKALNNTNRVVDINLLSDMPEYVGVAGAANIRLNLNYHKLYGLRLQRVSNIRVRQANIEHNEFFNYAGVASNSYINADDSNNIYLVDIAITGVSGIKPFSFYYSEITIQTLNLVNIDTMGLFECGSYLIGSTTHTLDVFASCTFGTVIQTRAVNVKIENGSGGSVIKNNRIYHTASTSVPTENGVLVNDVNLVNFKWITVCINIAGKGSHTYLWHGDRGTFDIFADFVDESGLATAYLTLTKTNTSITVSGAGTTGSKRITITDIYIEN